MNCGYEFRKLWADLMSHAIAQYKKRCQSIKRVPVFHTSILKVAMSTLNKQPLHQGFYRPLLITLLAVSGLFQYVLPAIADPTPPNTAISNTATATYKDPVTNTTVNTTSNTVTVTVTEVAGITVTPVSALDISPGGGFLPGNTVEYIFEVTNKGNDPTRFFIPSTAAVDGPGTQGTILISTNGGTSYVAIPSGNFTAAIPVGGKVLVKVPVTIDPAATTAANASIKVTLGDTGLNDNDPATQNVADAADGANANEVRTSDVPTETNGAPANGEREASAFQEIKVGAQKQAFAAVLKERTGYSNAGTATLSDDILTYKLSLRVDAARPTGSAATLQPSALAGTSITVNNVAVTRVLVSDAIPDKTVLTGAPSPSSGWTTVYTSDVLTTNATAAKWFTNASAIGGIDKATRIGFVNAGPIATGSPLIDFTFQVKTTGVTGTTTIANMAQLFGQTDGGGTTLVYDESGDQNPSNYNSGGTPGSNTPTDGKADPDTHGTDTGNSNGGDTVNTGLNGGGEDNVYTITAPGSILNGPQDQPGATGPNGINDDFTNKSTPITAGTAQGSLINPDPVTFTNTISSPTALTNVLLVPDDLTATNTLPKDTEVKITYNGTTVTYTYDGNDFIPSTTTPLTIPSIAANTKIDYTVEINLPINTPLSTDINTTRGDNPSYPVPIYAFQDLNDDKKPNPATEVSNATINRLYTGFLRLLKEARILDPDGDEIQGFSTAPVTKNIQPGNVIEYRVTYSNISMGQGGGANNQTLSASNVVITEDGVTGNNNWAEDQNTDGTIDTSNVPGTTTKTSGTITFAPAGDVQGTTAATDVTIYSNDLGTTQVAPGGTGSFTFRRRIN
jgi:hypothetical protein